jgi:hypothetical protein
MNERIRELAEQAKIHADEEWDFCRYTPTWFQVYNEKLTELIIQECIQQLVDDKEQYVVEGYNDEWNYAIDHSINTIKKLFGVEQ